MSADEAVSDGGLLPAPDMDHRAIARRVLSLLDLTSLSEEDDDERVRSLCRAAATPWGSPAAVCVLAPFVPTAREELDGAGLAYVRVATVANFPAGDSSPAAVMQEIRAARRCGADEVDVVFPWRAFLAGDGEAGSRLVTAAREAVGDGLLKVILETGELGDAVRIGEAARVAATHGADFLKTSTGKTPFGATPEAAEVLLQVIRERHGAIGMKVAGGVRTLQDARVYLEMAEAVMGPAWITPAHFRFGASSLLDDLVAHLSLLHP